MIVHNFRDAILAGDAFAATMIYNVLLGQGLTDEEIYALIEDELEEDELRSILEEYND